MGNSNKEKNFTAEEVLKQIIANNTTETVTLLKDVDPEILTQKEIKRGKALMDNPFPILPPTDAEDFFIGIDSEWEFISETNRNNILTYQYDTMLLSANGSSLAQLGQSMGFNKLEIPEPYHISRMKEYLENCKEGFEAYALRDAEIALLYGLKFKIFCENELGIKGKLPEAAIEAGVESHIADEVLAGKSNRRNGYNKKNVKSSNGSFELATPRDRDATFEPQIIKKHQTTVSDEIEDKILSMYGLGMSCSNISKHIEDIYSISLSTGTISLVTDKIIGKVKEWQQRQLESVYPFVWLDAIHYKIKEDG